MASVNIRVGLTVAEWAQVQKIAADTGVPVTRLTADAIRKSLLKGAKQ